MPSVSRAGAAASGLNVPSSPFFHKGHVTERGEGPDGVAMGAPTHVSHRYARPYDGQPLGTSALTLRKDTPTHIPTLGKRVASVASTIRRGEVATRLGPGADSETRGSG